MLCTPDMDLAKPGSTSCRLDGVFVAAHNLTIGSRKSETLDVLVEPVFCKARKTFPGKDYTIRGAPLQSCCVESDDGIPRAEFGNHHTIDYSPGT
jgi:hypothetical protein